MFRLEIETDNAAFEDDPAHEVCRILREAASRIERDASLAEGDKVPPRDANGNRVGFMIAK